MNKRYIVDERVGCAAVIDTFYPAGGNGLDSDSPRTMAYVHLPRCEDGCPLAELNERSDLISSLDVKAEDLNRNNIVMEGEVERATEEFRAAVKNLTALFPNRLWHDVRHLRDFVK